jgi:hypothetical protein
MFVHSTKAEEQPPAPVLKELVMDLASILSKNKLLYRLTDTINEQLKTSLGQTDLYCKAVLKQIEDKLSFDA